MHTSRSTEAESIITDKDNTGIYQAHNITGRINSAISAILKQKIKLIVRVFIHFKMNNMVTADCLVNTSQKRTLQEHLLVSQLNMRL